MTRRRSSASHAPSRPPNGSLWPFVLGAPLLVLLVVPVVLLVARTPLSSLTEELRSRDTRSAITVSLLTTSVSLAATVLFGTPLAYWLARSRSRAALLVQSVADLPTVLPPSVAGVALLLTLGRNGPFADLFRALGVQIAFTPVAVVIAQVFVASPYYVRAARAGFAAVSTDLREAAIIDGATGWNLVRLVFMPLASRSLAAGAAMSWSRALGEFGATIIFAGNLVGSTQTMPLAVYLGFENGLDRALVLSTLLIAISLVVLLAVRLFGARALDRTDA